MHLSRYCAYNHVQFHRRLEQNFELLYFRIFGFCRKYNYRFGRLLSFFLLHPGKHCDQHVYLHVCPLTYPENQMWRPNLVKCSSVYGRRQVYFWAHQTLLGAYSAPPPGQLSRHRCRATELSEKVAQLCCVSDIALRVTSALSSNE